MAFSETTLSITPLQSTTFIGDMKIAVNANNTLFKNAIESLINGLEIDLVNKYIGVDTPVSKIFSADSVVSNSIVFKAGSTSGAATIASLTQATGVSTFLVDNITMTKKLLATASGSLLASPTMIIGTDGSNLTVSYPTTGGIADKGLYVGDATTAIKTRLYGEVEIPKQSITQSYSNVGGSFTPRQISLTAGSADAYTYAKLVLTKTDPQFIYVDLVLPSGYTNYGNSIWLLLHESTSNRPANGQTFTVILNRVLTYDLNEVDYTQLPAISNTDSAAGINIICGANSALSTYKRAHINSSVWTSIPTTDVAAIAAAGTDDAYFVRFGNINNISSTAIHSPRDSSFSFTKTEQSTDYSNYTITSSQNTVIIK